MEIRHSKRSVATEKKIFAVSLVTYQNNFAFESMIYKAISVGISKWKEFDKKRYNQSLLPKPREKFRTCCAS